MAARRETESEVNNGYINMFNILSDGWKYTPGVPAKYCRLWYQRLPSNQVNSA